MRYSRFARLTDPARPSAGLWRLAMGALAILAVTLALSQALVSVLGGLLGPGAAGGLPAGDSPAGLLALLGLTGALGLATLLVAETLHGRGLRSLLGPWALFRTQSLRVLMALGLLNAAVLLLPPWPLAAASAPGLAPGLWLALLPVTLAVLVLQTGSEELFFRGYLQSQLGARLRHPAVWLGLPALLFALGHYAPAHYGGNAGLVALWALIFGLAAGDLTARAGTLGPALALHLVNNTLAVALAAPSGAMSGLALRRYPFDAGNEAAMAALLPADLAMIALSWLAARLAIRR